MARAGALSINVVDTVQQGLQQRCQWLLSQYAEFIIAVQPVALFPFLAVLARLVCGIEIPVLRALLAVQISQQQYAWVGERLYDMSLHDRFPGTSVAGGVLAATRCIAKD